MGVQTALIFLSGKTLYYAGETVNAFCEISTTEPVPLPSFDVTLRGRTRVHWTETHSHSTEGRTETVVVTYEDSRDLLTLSQTIPIPNSTLSPGRNVIPFSVQLPMNMETSFEGPHGYIRYWLDAHVPPSVFSVQIAGSVIRVLQHIDTNIPQYDFVVAGNDRKMMCCGAEGPLVIEAKTDRAAYCPEEIVTVTARLENSSRRQVKPYAKLIRREVMTREGNAFTRGKNIKTHEFPLTPLENPNVMDPLLEHTSTSWDKIRFALPATIPTVSSVIIQVSYYIEVGFVVPRSFDLKVLLPVVIGTVPYSAHAVTKQPLVAFSHQAWTGKGGKDAGTLVSAVPFQQNNQTGASSVAYKGPMPACFETLVAPKPILQQQ